MLKNAYARISIPHDAEPQNTMLANENSLLQSPPYLQAVRFNNSQSILGPTNFLPLVYQRKSITINSPNNITGV